MSVLRGRKIRNRGQLLTKVLIFHIFDVTHHLKQPFRCGRCGFLPKPSTNGVLTITELTSERFIDDRYSCRFGCIVIIEISPGEQTSVHCSKVITTDVAKESFLLLAGIP